jgi:hypothetical protein
MSDFESGILINLLKIESNTNGSPEKSSRRQDLKSFTGVSRPTVSEGRAATPSFKLLFLSENAKLESD